MLTKRRETKYVRDWQTIEKVTFEGNVRWKRDVYLWFESV